MSNHAKLISEAFRYPRYAIWMVLLACGCHNQPGAYSLLWEASPGAANTGSQQWLNLHIINSESRSQQGNCDCRFWVIVMDLSSQRSQLQGLKQVHRWLGAGQGCHTTPWCHLLIINVNLGKLNCVWAQKWYPGSFAICLYHCVCAEWLARCWGFACSWNAVWFIHYKWMTRQLLKSQT